MKLDLDYIREILEAIENRSDGITETRFEISGDSAPEEKRRFYHQKLLINEGLVDGDIDDVGSMDGPAFWVRYVGLTMQGHQLLESMKNDTLWNKVKDGVIQAGVEGLKQIPALALNLLATGMAK